MPFSTVLFNSNPHFRPLQETYRMDEDEALNHLLNETPNRPLEPKVIEHTARNWIEGIRAAHQKNNKNIDALLRNYDLSSDEGIALMCLAEALLRIPDEPTRALFIYDKLSRANWKEHLKPDKTWLLNAATWSLLITGKAYAGLGMTPSSLTQNVTGVIGKIGRSLLQPVIMKMMKLMGSHFVMGETIEEAVKRSRKSAHRGYRFSFDMLGEAARTQETAEAYFQSYLHAIDVVGKYAKKDFPLEENGSISIKLSALHPRYEYAQAERVLETVPALVLQLAKRAREHHIPLTIDAEETDRLELSLEIFQRVFSDASLRNWNGLGLAVQAYQKRAYYVIDFLITLARTHHKRIPIRLVKGAYWDAEIKTSQLLGLHDYPVFTRKSSTDTSYFACAQKILKHTDCFYPQFGTHNAYTASTIAHTASAPFEFQCLHGMGNPLYDQLVHAGKKYDCRIYAPVGHHKDLLGYLVRRLLENGANTSFINQLAHMDTSVDALVRNPVEKTRALTNKRHPNIPLPKNIYASWKNARGIDLSNPIECEPLQLSNDTVNARSIINGEYISHPEKEHSVFSPIDGRAIGTYSEVNIDDLEKAVSAAKQAEKKLAAMSCDDRANILERAADLFEAELPAFLQLLVREAGKCIPDAIGEIRETIDFCRYYAHQARVSLAPVQLPSPTGEENMLSYHPRGTILCISPWNFPLAIFCGQMLAAFAAGNAVITKPAEQTPLVACKAVELLHRAGIPKNALHLVLGSGRIIGTHLTKDPRISGVVFTGSTQTAKSIERNLAAREGQIGLLIAETGGQNAMIVDSSALPEQTVMDVMQSAFNSAGQRCSALRVLCLQEEIADTILHLLKGALHEWNVGNPAFLSSDMGPVIGESALKTLQNHFQAMMEKGTLIAQAPHRQHEAGHYFAPAVFEIPSVSILTEEVFGPILHVVRYKRTELKNLLESIIQTGYGLTLGVQSRIAETQHFIHPHMPVGNQYVNRNMIGAVVGVQPFGGEGLSGTGPKAGGLHYLHRLSVERVLSTNTTAVGGNARLVSLLEEEE